MKVPGVGVSRPEGTDSLQVKQTIHTYFTKPGPDNQYIGPKSVLNVTATQVQHFSSQTFHKEKSLVGLNGRNNRYTVKSDDKIVTQA